MKNYKRYSNKRTGEQASWEDIAKMVGLNDDIKEGTRIKMKGEYYLVDDIKPRNRKYPILISNRDGKRKATVGFVNNAEIIIYDEEK